MTKVVLIFDWARFLIEPTPTLILIEHKPIFFQIAHCTVNGTGNVLHELMFVFLAFVELCKDLLFTYIHITYYIKADYDLQTANILRLFQISFFFASAFCGGTSLVHE